MCVAPISSRAAALSVTWLHQQPDHDSSHANACPHASQRDGRFSVGPERVHWKTKVTTFEPQRSAHEREGDLGPAPRIVAAFGARRQLVPDHRCADWSREACVPGHLPPCGFPVGVTVATPRRYKALIKIEVALTFVPWVRFHCNLLTAPNIPRKAIREVKVSTVALERRVGSIHWSRFCSAPHDAIRLSRRRRAC